MTTGGAHPRVGGENDGSRLALRMIVGSSPRGRGKPVPIVVGVQQLRLIPAWAGKTSYRSMKL